MALFTKGHIVSEEVRKKISNSQMGNSYHLGKKHSKESKQRMSETRTGRYTGENSPSFGKKHSEESKRKMSEAKMGKTSPRKGVILTEETKRKISESAPRGENHPNWNGGSSFLPYSSEWNGELREFIKSRDNNECQNPFCEHKNKKLQLQVHHIDYNKKNSSQFNLITLCIRCHPKTNHNREYWEAFYKKIVWSKFL
jgi:5-methylcytosine-specific restriction endonuclease McrA